MKPDFEPGYVRLLSRSALAARVTSAYRHLEPCDLCARYCQVNRRSDPVSLRMPLSRFVAT